MKLCYIKKNSHFTESDVKNILTRLFCLVVSEVTVLIRAAVNYLCAVSPVIKLASNTLVSHWLFLEEAESICPQ